MNKKIINDINMRFTKDNFTFVADKQFEYY